MLSIRTLTYAYKKNHPILRNVNADIRPGFIYGLLGLNGEGKTTLLKVIIGMLLPKTGQVTFNQISSNQRISSYFDQVYYLSDTSQLPAIKVAMFGKLYGAFYSLYSHDQFLDHIREFQVSADQNIKNLSLGQQRKVHIAFALACNCPLLLMDEPTNGLDIPSKGTFRKLVAENMSDEKIFIIATHQIRDIDNLLDHLLIMKDGTITVNESLDQLSKKYSIAKTVNDRQKVIYTENNLSGPHYLIENNGIEETKPDIEFLFNAFTQNEKNN